MGGTPMNVTIDINLERKCSQCGKKGATPSGICLKCITKNLKVGRVDPGVAKIIDCIFRKAPR
jgi:hypothetical protein